MKTVNLLSPIIKKSSLDPQITERKASFDPKSSEMVDKQPLQKLSSSEKAYRTKVKRGLRKQKMGSFKYPTKYLNDLTQSLSDLSD